MSNITLIPPTNKHSGGALGLARSKVEKNLPKYLEQVTKELYRATEAYGPFNSPHEGYGIIKEELDEFWDEVKTNNNPGARKEIVQVAAMALRYLLDSEHWS